MPSDTGLRALLRDRLCTADALMAERMLDEVTGEARAQGRREALDDAWIAAEHHCGEECQGAQAILALAARGPKEVT